MSKNIQIETGGEDTDSSSQGPVWEKDIPINSKKRNLQVVIWGGDKGPSIALEEGRNTGDSWENNRIYLPVAKGFEIAERIKEASVKVRDKEV